MAQWATSPFLNIYLPLRHRGKFGEGHGTLHCVKLPSLRLVPI